MEGQLELNDFLDTGTCPNTVEESVDIKTAADELSVSTATIRNWVKLGKLHPLSTNSRKIRFKRSDIDKVVADIISGKSDKLTKRRNKKAVKGVDLYTDYIQDSGSNILIGAKLVKNEPLVFSEECIRVILADLAVKLYYNKHRLPSKGVIDYLENGKDNSFIELLKELLNGSDCRKYENIISEIGNPVFVPYQDFLGFIYISINKIANRKSTGSYFTPIVVVEQLLDALCGQMDIFDKKIVDPCCGTGNFILAALKRGVNISNLYGRDLDNISSCIAKLNVFLNGISDVKVLNSHITNSDSLFSDFPTEFDIVIGNPPWGYEYSAKDIEALMKSYTTASLHGTESYDLFLERSIKLLKEDGVIAYVLPEALLNVKTHLQARRIIQDECSISFVDYLGNVFAGVACPCIILGIKKDGKKTAIGCTVKIHNQEFIIRKERDLTNEYWNFSLSDTDECCVNKISSVENCFTLKGNADFALGIVTGANKEYISNNKTDGSEEVLKGSNLYKFYFKPSGNYIRFEPDNFQQVAPVHFYRSTEKLLYRFICATPVFSYDNHQTLSLNSANILIPHVDGIDIKYILAILNSRTISFWCRKKYNSVKLLRSHIESIPFPKPSSFIQEKIVTMTDYLIDSSTLSFADRLKIYESLENIIMDLYQLDAPDRDLINADSNQFDSFL